MADMVSAKRRSEIMKSICSSNTSPEKEVRSVLHMLGYRFRIHRKDLPGTPDIVLPKLQTVIMVHGCFWHQHTCRRGRHIPKSNTEYWISKIKKNTIRDKRNAKHLENLGWRRIVIWECQAKDSRVLCDRLQALLKSNSSVLD
jgi:DNA mismatch endonuclease (patch repair protein)